MTTCCLCKDKGEDKVYVGESSRTAFERGQEHIHDYEKEHLDSHMSKHHLNDHAQEEKPTFSMKVVKCHTSALTRQIHEAILIQKHEKNILNSRGEYNRCQLPRLTVMMGEKEVESRTEVTDREIEQVFDTGDAMKRKTDDDDQGRPGKRAKRTARWNNNRKNVKRKIRDEEEMISEERDIKKRKDEEPDKNQTDGGGIQKASQTSMNLSSPVKDNEVKQKEFSFSKLACKVKSTQSLSKFFEDKISPTKNFFPVFTRKSTPSPTSEPTATYKRGGGRGVKQKRKGKLEGLGQLQTNRIEGYFKPQLKNKPSESDHNYTNKCQGGKTDQAKAINSCG